MCVIYDVIINLICFYFLKELKLLKFMVLCILLIVFCEIFIIIRMYNKFCFLYRKYEYIFNVNCFLEINVSFIIL